MTFNSWQYALFLPGVVLAYWLLPLRGRILLLVAASYFFYGMWDARFLALLSTTTIVDFFGVLAIAGSRLPALSVLGTSFVPLLWLLACRVLGPQPATVTNGLLAIAAFLPFLYVALYRALWRLPEPRQKRAFLVLSLCANLGTLGFFKYFNFFAGSLSTLLGSIGWDPGWTLPHIILPIGISFYTFQSISYAVDVYRGIAAPSRDFLTFAAFVSFFPQLVAGPIERRNDLLPQFETARPFAVEDLHVGLRLILIGLFKKIFVADNCAVIVNYAFAPHTVLNAQWALLSVLAFAFQIYGDFSGYTDIARGSARLLGVKLNRNFKFPYFATNPSDFWRRWHITLSLWFRDYVYIPLGGNQAGTLRTFANLGITFFLAGLWHGARWNFVIWGCYYALLLIIYHGVPVLQRWADPDKGTHRLISGIVMFAFTLVGWAIFRSDSLGQIGSWFEAFARWDFTKSADWIKPSLWWLLHVVPLLLLQWATLPSRDEAELDRFSWPVRGIIYTLIFLVTASSVAPDVEFIYFQF